MSQSGGVNFGELTLCSAFGQLIQVGDGGGPTLCPAFGQLIQGGGVFRGYLKLIPDSRVVAGHLTN